MSDGLGLCKCGEYATGGGLCFACRKQEAIDDYTPPEPDFTCYLVGGVTLNVWRDEVLLHQPNKGVYLYAYQLETFFEKLGLALEELKSRGLVK